MADEQVVSADEVLRSQGAEEPVTGGTFLQRTGLTLAAFVGGLGGLVILCLIGKWILYAPPAPSFSPGTDQATIKLGLENYKTLQQIALEPFTALFDSA